MTKASANNMYSSVVSRETVRVTAMMTAINDHEVKSADIFNAYI